MQQNSYFGLVCFSLGLDSVRQILVYVIVKTSAFIWSLAIAQGFIQKFFTGSVGKHWNFVLKNIGYIALKKSSKKFFGALRKVIFNSRRYIRHGLPRSFHLPDNIWKNSLLSIEWPQPCLVSFFSNLMTKTKYLVSFSPIYAVEVEIFYF